MYVMIGIIFIGIGLIMLLSPQTVFEIVESWKNSGNSEPSKLYIISTRFSGSSFLIIGLASVIIQFFSS